MPLIWGLANQVWASLITLAAGAPFVGWALYLVVMVWLGFRGHELAWQHRTFDSLDDYRTKMRAWDLAGVWICAAGIAGGFLGLFSCVPMLELEGARRKIVIGVLAGLATAGSTIMAIRVSDRISRR